MAITSVKYIRDEEEKDSVVRIIYNNDTSVKITVQVDNEDNRHWQQVKEWVAEGNTIQEAD